MIRNLLENAVRYTDRGEIRLECCVEQHHARISVHDAGVGIPPDQTAHIFEEFHRGSDQGLGLGLAIVQRLSMILNHPVDVRSTVGQGSTFSIVVPLASPQREAPAKQTRATQAGAGKTVLVIDDDHMVLLSLSSTLRDWGYRTITAASTEQALKRLRQAGKPPHAVIVDYRLRSGETGTQAIAAIRRSFDQPIPAIILTGETAGAADEAAAELGLTALRKPVAPEDLAAALEQPGR